MKIEEHVTTPPAAPAGPGANEKVLFWASFLTLIAAGIGFSVRGAILGEWGRQFGFTQSELGGITGFGLAGFGVTIIVLSFFADRVGYGPLMVLAFLLHFSSGVVTLGGTYVFQVQRQRSRNNDRVEILEGKQLAIILERARIFARDLARLIPAWFVNIAKRRETDARHAQESSHQLLPPASRTNNR